MLALALSNHEGALRASLYATYRLRLEELMSWPAREAAALVIWLPAGCALWQDVGGPAALSMEARESRTVEFRLRQLMHMLAGGKGSKPKPLPEREWAHERRASEQRMLRKAARFMERQKN